MKKWMLLLSGWLVLFGVLNLLPHVVRNIPPKGMYIADIALWLIAIVTGILVFVDK